MDAKSTKVKNRLEHLKELRELQKQNAEVKKLRLEIESLKLKFHDKEEQYKRAAEAGQVGIWDWNLETDEIYVDPYLKAILGYRDHEIENCLEDWGKRVHPEDSQMVMKEAQAHIQGKRPYYEVVHRMLHKDGTVRWFLARGNVICNKKGKPLRMTGTDTNITEIKKRELEQKDNQEKLSSIQKQVEEKLKESENRYRALVEQSLVGVCIVNEEGFLYHNEAGARIFGYSPEEIVGQLKPSDLVSPVDRTRVANNIKKSLNGKVKKIRYTFRGLRKDGSEIDCEVYNRLIKYIGKPAILGTCLDITEQKKAEKELLESEEKFRVLAEQSPNMIFINKNSRVLYCNKRCEELMGYTTEEFCSPEFDFFSLIVPVDVELVKKNFKKYKKGCDIEPFEYTLLTKVGQKIEVIINARLIKYEREESILCVVTDITKRKQAEETLIKSESQLQAFFNNAAVGISVADPNGQYIKVNNHYLEMFGYKDELELFKKTVGENTYPEDRQSTRKAQQDLASGRIDFIRLEKRYIRKDGSIFWGDISASPIHDPDGKIRAFVAIINDISERKQVEVSLQFTQFAIDRNADAAFWMGEDARVIYVNEAACRSLGYSKEELLTMTVHEIDPDFPAEVWPDHWKDLRKRGSFTIQSHHRTKEGQVFPVEIQLNFVRFEGKEYNCAFARNITEHKKTEEALRESEKKFRDLVNLLPQTVFEVDLVGNFTFANQHGFKTFLYTQEDLDKGLNALKMFVPEDRDRGKYNFRKILAGKKVESQKYTGLKKDGNTFPVVIYSSPIIRENQPVGIRGIVVDISERRELEMKLKNVAREWNITFDAIKDPIALLDINRKIKRCNKAQMDFLNKPFKKILDNAVYELVHGDKKTPEDCPFQRMLESKQRESSEQKKKNSWLRCTVDPIFDDSGEIIGAVHIISDISESKQAEIQITKQNEFMNLILESLTHPFYIIDTSNYQIVKSNPAANQFDLADYSTCYRLTHMQEQPCNGINHPCPIKEIQKNRKPVNVEHVHFDKKGNKKNFDIYAYPIFDEKNNVIQIIEYSIDITERRRAEESAKKQYQQLLQADKMVSLGVLASGMAHEINNPNNSIKLNAQFLQKAWKSIIPIMNDYYKENRSLIVGGIRYNKFRTKVPQLFSGILDSSNRIRFIVDDLKRFFRKEPSGKKDPVDINSVVKTGIALMKNIIDKSTRNFQVSYGNNLPRIKGNFQQLEQVVVNLLENACHALTSPSKRIFVSVSFDKKSNRLVVSVEDEGIGISTKDLKFITDPFYTTKRSTGGTGLGLSVSTKIINEHNGFLEFESNPGQGTTVKVYFNLEHRE